MCTRSLVVIAVISALVGCTINYYLYDGQVFHSRAAALAAQQESNGVIDSAVERRSMPVANQARVIVPDKTAILRGLSEGQSEEIRDYLATLLYDQFQLVPRLIKKRNLFRQVDVEVTSTIEHRQPTPGVVTIYIGANPETKSNGYFYASETTPRAPIHFNPKDPDRTKRYLDFLARIEALAASEKRN